MSKKRFIVIIFIIVIFLISILISNNYYKNKYKVSFETGTEDKILTQYIEKGKTATEPDLIEKEGYIFIEWQLNGEKYDFNKIVENNIILNAKWVKEEYITIKYVTDSNYVIEDKKILKGSSINNLPDAYKDGYEFIGWYLNDKIYENEIINDDTTLIAYYNVIKKEYKIGDEVTIIGNYAESAYSKIAVHSKAIGWKRKILRIIDNSEFPYVLGNEHGVTGFFKENSLN